MKAPITYASISVSRFDKGKGKPCGEGYISSDKKCREGEGAALKSPETKEAIDPEAKKKAEVAKGQWILAATILGIYATAVVADVAIASARQKEYEEAARQWRERYSNYYGNYRSSWNNAYGSPPREEKKPEWWDVLGVNKNASAEDVRKAYKKKAREFHPDVNKSPEAEEMMKNINDAFDRSGRRRDSLVISAARLDALNALLVNLQKKKVEPKVYARI